MKKFFLYTLLVAFVATFSFTSCKDDGTGGDEAVAYETLTTHLKSIDMDVNHVLKNANDQKFVMFPADGDLSGKWVMDIRSAADFAAGHIEGAHNVAFKDILTAAATADKDIVVVCVTGQTACYATSLLRLYGEESAQALKWGMSGWNEQYNKWTPNCNDLIDDNNWTVAQFTPSKNAAPVINSITTDGAALLKERVEAVVAAGFKTVKGSDVLANPGNYYVNNYFNTADYAGFGHVDGAYRINPLMIDNFDDLDPSAKVVTYCYTGQTSAVLTAYLNVCGFDAYSLTFGVNGMTTTNPYWEAGGIANHWGYNANPKDFPTK